MTEEKNELQDTLQPDGEATDTENTEEVTEQDLDEEEVDNDSELSDEEETDNEDDLETDESDDGDVTELKKKNKQLYHRAKKAENLLKKYKQTEPKDKLTINQNNLTREEAFLIARGYSEEDLENLTVLREGFKAKKMDKTLTELVDHPLFKAVQESKKEQDKKAKAQLQASKANKKPQSKPMTDEEHAEFAKAKSQEVLSNM